MEDLVAQIEPLFKSIVGIFLVVAWLGVATAATALGVFIYRLCKLNW